MSELEPNYEAPSNGKVYVLYGAVIILLALNVYIFVQFEGVRSDLSNIQTSMRAEVAELQENTTKASSTTLQSVKTLAEELEAARRQAATAAGQARREAQAHADQLAKELEAEQQKQQQMVASQLSEVKESANAANAKLADVTSDFTDVQTRFNSAKSDLDATIKNLKSATGDLGVNSGLIATNAKELAALRALGGRNYLEFNIRKSKEHHKVGDITIRLTKSDEKRNKYTIVVVADDKTVEKKDKTVNEPVQFYVSGVGRPYEIVVNQVNKDQIVGYLATPQVRAPRT